MSFKHYVSNPLEDDLSEFVANVEHALHSGDIGMLDYCLAVGRLVGYAECRIALAKAAGNLEDLNTQKFYDLTCDVLRILSIGR